MGIGVSGSRTGAGGCGSVSGGKGIGLGFGLSGSDGSCGVTGGISGFSTESVSQRVVKLCKRFPLVRKRVYSGLTMLTFSLSLRLKFICGPCCVVRGFNSPWTIASRAMILGSAN